MMHFIVTRNTYPPGDKIAASRRELTRKYTIPSLRGQENKSFTWLLIGANGLEAEDLEGIPHLIMEAAAPQHFEESIYQAQRLIKHAALEADAGERIITTRLDNDDILLPGFVSAIQLAALNHTRAVIDMAGYRLDLRDDTAYLDTAYRRVPSPFLSLVEEKACRKCRMATAYYDQHSCMHRHFPFFHLETPGWIQLIHGSNKVMARDTADIRSRGQLLDISASEMLRRHLPSSD